MEISKGMYIRTKKGIGKINEIRDFMGELEFHLDSNTGKIHNVTNNTYWNNIDDIIGEPSFNLIDLIEVGDYVNGYKVLFIDVFFSEGKNVKCINNEEERVCFYEEDIKDIITKEQFNSMKYVVERDTNENL